MVHNRKKDQSLPTTWLAHGKAHAGQPQRGFFRSE